MSVLAKVGFGLVMVVLFSALLVMTVMAWSLSPVAAIVLGVGVFGLGCLAVDTVMEV